MTNIRDITYFFETKTARRLHALRRIKDPKKRSVREFLDASVAFSVEREKIFRKMLHIKRDDEAKRAEVKDLSLTLLRKTTSLIGADRLNLFSEEHGFFVYNQNKARVIAVAPEEAGVSYFLITGVRMRSMHPRLLEKLARVGYLTDRTAYIQPKVLEHEEYEHLIELLLKEQKGGESE
ncbi:MAG TPA: hypothetical protein VMW41_07040 [Candidatus Bathyarchaeia archaeon]|nr:hypothetical protein [Candidatus Bathyarchaeia archaeon]